MFDKECDQFEILIEQLISLRMDYKDMDQFIGLLEKEKKNGV